MLMSFVVTFSLLDISVILPENTNLDGWMDAQMHGGTTILNSYLFSIGNVSISWHDEFDWSWMVLRGTIVVILLHIYSQHDSWHIVIDWIKKGE